MATLVKIDNYAQRCGVVANGQLCSSRSDFITTIFSCNISILTAKGLMPNL